MSTTINLVMIDAQALPTSTQLWALDRADGARRVLETIGIEINARRGRLPIRPLVTAFAYDVEADYLRRFRIVGSAIDELSGA